MAKPKVRKRKKKPAKPGPREPVIPISAPPIERRGMADLARLGQALSLEPLVRQRRQELDDLARLMGGTPRGR